MKYQPPHCKPRGRGTTVYIAGEKLTLDGVEVDLPGAGVFYRYDDRLLRTKQGSSRSLWSLPTWFAPDASRPALGYHSDLNRWRRAGDRLDLQSATRGQEIVLDTMAYPELVPLGHGSTPSPLTDRDP